MPLDLAMDASAGHRLVPLRCPDVFRQMVVDLAGVPSRSRLRSGRPQALAWQDRAAWLRALPAEVVDRLADDVVTHRVQAGQSLRQHVVNTPGWVGVVEGFLVVEAPVSFGATASFGLPGGAWYGEQGLLLGHVCEDRLTAAVPSRVALLPNGCFQALLEEQPAFARMVLQIQAQRVAALRSRLAWPRRPGADAIVALRIAELFATDALFDGEYRVALPQRAMSTFVGLSRQRTNAALNRLRRLDEIDLAYGGIRVKNPTRLYRRALDGDLD